MAAIWPEEEMITLMNFSCASLCMIWAHESEPEKFKGIMDGSKGFDCLDPRGKGMNVEQSFQRLSLSDDSTIVKWKSAIRFIIQGKG